MLRRWLLLATWVCLSACGDDPTSPEERRTSDASVSVPEAPKSDGGLVYTFPCLFQRPPTHEATFTSVYRDIFCHAGCANFYCHGNSGQWGDLDLSASIEVAYAQLVGQRTGVSIPADGRPTCRESTLLRVAPGDPEHSVLYLKVSATTPCGTRMPPASSGMKMLSPDEQEQIRQWILAGAPLGDVSDASTELPDAALGDAGDASLGDAGRAGTDASP
ncbi:MAG: hypothetical protein QM778_14590 [Myxococcales bacterium]